MGEQNPLMIVSKKPRLRKLRQTNSNSPASSDNSFEHASILLPFALSKRIGLSESQIREIFQTNCIHKLTRVVNTGVQTGFYSLQSIISTEGTGIGVIVFPNRKSQSFTETIVKNYLTDDIHEYDVSSKGIVCEETGKAGEVCSECKMKVFVRVMEELPFAHLKPWLRYQVDIRENKLLFLEELQGLLMDNRTYFLSKDTGRLEHCCKLIESMTYSLEQAGLDNVVLKKDEYEHLVEKANATQLPKIRWVGKKKGLGTALIEIVLGMANTKDFENEKGMPPRQELIKVFSAMTGIDFQYLDQTLHQMKSRKLQKTPYLNKMTIAVERFLSETNDDH